MKRVRLYAMLLSSALFISTVPATQVSAAQGGQFQEYSSAKTGESGSLTVLAKSQAETANTNLGWTKKDNKWYYVTAKGNHTGWAKINGKYYYFDNSGAMCTGWVKNGGKWYYMAATGAMKTGWQKINKKWYYFDLGNGSMQVGWLKLNGKYYYLERNGQLIANCWKKISGRWYYFGESGRMYAGPHVYKIDGKYYFFESSGALTNKTGFQTSDLGNTFYTNADGTIATNKEIDGKLINSEGICVQKMSDEMDQKAQWYDSDTNFLVLADLSNHEMRVYQGKKGNWNKIKGGWEFSCGAPATYTPCGQFKLIYKYNSSDYGWKDFNLSKAAYVYWTTAGFMLHTILYDKYSEGDPEYCDVVDGRLGMNISLSCIRLELESARWIYTNIPTCTKLVVYE